MPVLGPMGYGEYIFHGRGTHGYLNALAEPAWADISARLKDLLPEKSTTDGNDRMRAVVAMLADPIGGQPLFEHPVCPHCSSHDVDRGAAAAGKSRELPAVTFTAYRALTDERRDADVAAAWKKAVVRPKTQDDRFEKMRAIRAIFSVFRMYHFNSNSDLRLGSYSHLFEDGTATRAEIESAIEFMLEKRWLVENEVSPGGHRLTAAGVAAMNELPLAELKGVRLEHGKIRSTRPLVVAAVALGACALGAFAVWKWLEH